MKGPLVMEPDSQARHALLYSTPEYEDEVL